MKFKKLKIGILHSLIGKNDGVSIVIDDTVESMIEDMKIPLGNIFFLAAHSPARFNVTTNEIFWHKNDINMMAVKYFSEKQHFSVITFLYLIYHIMIVGGGYYELENRQQRFPLRR